MATPPHREAPPSLERPAKLQSHHPCYLCLQQSMLALSWTTLTGMWWDLEFYLGFVWKIKSLFPSTERGFGIFHIIWSSAPLASREYYGLCASPPTWHLSPPPSLPPLLPSSSFLRSPGHGVSPQALIKSFPRNIVPPLPKKDQIRVK